MDGPGLLVVWSGRAPRLDIIPIPEDGLHYEDATFSRPDYGDGIEIRARSSITFNGQPFNGHAPCATFTSILRFGQTVAVLVPSVAEYEQVKLARRGSVVVGASLAAPLHALDRAAYAETHVAIVGALALGRQLAQVYAETVGGTSHIVELTKSTTLERQLAGAKPRTLVLALHRPLSPVEKTELAQWLETEIRIITLVRDARSLAQLPDILRATEIELPKYRFDELPTVLAERAPDRVDAQLIERALVEARWGGDEAYEAMLRR